MVELFDTHLAKTLAERRQMFGCPCGFVNGQMFCGLFGQKLFLRLGGADRAELLALPDAEPFDPMGGRPMKEYVVAPPALLEDASALDAWFSRAHGYAQALPPKKPAKASPNKATRASTGAGRSRPAAARKRKPSRRR